MPDFYYTVLDKLPALSSSAPTDRELHVFADAIASTRKSLWLTDEATQAFRDAYYKGSSEHALLLEIGCLFDDSLKSNVERIVHAWWRRDIDDTIDEELAQVPKEHGCGICGHSHHTYECSHKLQDCITAATGFATTAHK